MDNNFVLETILHRRSVRRYRPENVPDDILQKIIEAGRYAPSGGNNQTSHFLVLQNPAVLSELKKLVTQEFAKMEYTENTYKSIKSSILQSRRGDYDFFYSAPTLIVAANQKGYGNAMADCAAAIENMMLAADSLGIGSCWINQLHWLDENEVIRNYLYTLGLNESETVCGGVSLGYSAEGEKPPLKRMGNEVTMI